MSENGSSACPLDRVVIRIPDDWKLVPREPHQEQTDYAAYNINRKQHEDIVTPWLVNQCYHNMLFAAPRAPALETVVPERLKKAAAEAAWMLRKQGALEFAEALESAMVALTDNEEYPTDQ